MPVEDSWMKQQPLWVVTSALCLEPAPHQAVGVEERGWGREEGRGRGRGVLS